LRNQGLRATLKSDDASTNRPEPKSTTKAAESDLSMPVKETKPQVDEFSLGLDRVEVFLIEQNLKEALIEYRKVLAIERNSMTFDMFLRKQRFSDIIVEELKNSASLIKPNTTLDFSKISMHIDALVEFGYFREAVEVVLIYANQTLRAETKPATFQERVTRLLDTALATITFLNERFKVIYSQNEFVFLFSGWVTEEFVKLLKFLQPAPKMTTS